MQFDKTIDDQYGIIYGKKELVYIKTGRGGSIYGEDNKYYEIDIYRALPSDNSTEYWNRVNGIFENTPSYGGIGGAT